MRLAVPLLVLLCWSSGTSQEKAGDDWPTWSGLEVVAEGLPLDPIPWLETRDLKRYLPRQEKR